MSTPINRQNPTPLQFTNPVTFARQPLVQPLGRPINSGGVQSQIVGRRQGFTRAQQLQIMNNPNVRTARTKMLLALGRVSSDFRNFVQCQRPGAGSSASACTGSSGSASGTTDLVNNLVALFRQYFQALKSAGQNVQAQGSSDSAASTNGSNTASTANTVNATNSTNPTNTAAITDALQKQRIQLLGVVVNMLKGSSGASNAQVKDYLQKGPFKASDAEISQLGLNATPVAKTSVSAPTSSDTTTPRTTPTQQPAAAKSPDANETPPDGTTVNQKPDPNPAPAGNNPAAATIAANPPDAAETPNPAEG